MIFRRISQHVREQNWFAVGIDFVIVVVGVFVGLQVQQWTEAQRQGRLERFYTERLHAEVVSLMSIRETLVSMRSQMDTGLSSATRVLFGEEDRELTEFECRSMAYSYFVSNPTDELASLIELQSTGQFSVFSNTRVSAALGSFLLTRARARDANAGSGEAVLNLASRHPDLLQVVVPAGMETTPLTSAIYRCDLEGMRASRAFLNDYETARVNYALHVKSNARIDASLTELKLVLMDVLGRVEEAASP
jgi:hypothetical protein